MSAADTSTSNPAYQDAYISDIVVVFDESADNKFEDVVAKLKEHGMQIASADKDNGVIEGTVDSSKIHEIDDLPGVSYVRSVFTYVADFPPGDPRDRDKVARPW
jgi:hypothetical protein